jgi:ABC-type polar amino acid transport system ATPase subunit
VRLSGGQVQRAAVARMLLRDAELLVFDDVSSALEVAQINGVVHMLEGVHIAPCNRYCDDDRK